MRYQPRRPRTSPHGIGVGKQLAHSAVIFGRYTLNFTPPVRWLGNQRGARFGPVDSDGLSPVLAADTAADATVAALVGSFATNDTQLLLPASALGAEPLQLRIEACDGVGLCTSAIAAQYVQLVHSAPSGCTDCVELLDASYTPLPNASFFNDQTWLAARWHNMSSGAAAAGAPQLTYELCVGTSPDGCQVSPFRRAGLSQASVPHEALECGRTYYATLRATNCAGLRSVFSSSPAKLCCGPPAVGHVSLMDSSGRSIRFFGSSADVLVRWQGFAEGCAGLLHYVVRLECCGGWSWASESLDASNSSLALPSSVLLGRAQHTPTTEFVVSVTATSRAGLASMASANLTADMTPPAEGVLYDGALPRTLATCQPVSQPIHVSWSGFMDAQSGVREIAWAIGSAPLLDDLKPFAHVHPSHNGSTPLSWRSPLGLQDGAIVYASLRVTNHAGDVTNASSDGLSLLAGQCAPPVRCTGTSSGVTPMFAMLAMSLLTERSYRVVSYGVFPQHGSVETRLTVHLKEMESDRAGSRFMRLEVADDGVAIDSDGYSDRAGFHTRLRLHAHPFFFHVRRDGSVHDLVFHHDDAGPVLANKKLLVSHLQVRLPASARRKLRAGDGDGGGSRATSSTRRSGALNYTLVEQDVHGPATVSYSARVGLFGRRVVEKLQRWHAANGLPHTVEAIGSTRVILDGAHGAPLSVSAQFLVKKLDEPSDEEARHAEAKFQKISGFEMLPSDPVSSSWTLLPVVQGARTEERRRQLRSHRDDIMRDELLRAHGYRSAELGHPLSDEATHWPGRGTVGKQRDLLKEDADAGFDCETTAYDEMEDQIRCAWSAKPQKDVADNARVGCVQRLEEISRQCPELPVVREIEKLMSEQCIGVFAEECGSLVNALGMLDAQHALASFISRLCVRHLPDETRAVLVGANPPSEELLRALADRLDTGEAAQHGWLDGASAARARSADAIIGCKEHPDEDLDGEVRPTPRRRGPRTTTIACIAHVHLRAEPSSPSQKDATHASRLWQVRMHDEQAWLNLLLASAAVARHASRTTGGAGRIHQHVLGFLDGISRIENQTWSRAHASAVAAAERMWARKLDDKERELWVTEHSQLDQKALVWSIDHGLHGAHVAHAKRALATSLHRRQTDRNDEQVHHIRLRTALRAVENLRPADRPTLLRVIGYVDHHEDGVQTDAIGALRAFESAQAESVLLARLAKLARPASGHGSRYDPQAMLHVVKTLSHWHHVRPDGQGIATLSEAVRLLLRMDREFVTRMLHDKDRKPEEADRPCVRACVRTCNPFVQRKDCRHQCSDACLSGMFIAHELGKLVQRAAKDAGAGAGDDVADAAWLEAVMKPLLRAHGRHAHPSWHVLEGAAPHRYTDAFEDEQDEWHVFEPASYGRGPDHAESAIGRRRQLLDWSHIDFNSFSLTFIDVHITMGPSFNLHKQYGITMPAGMGHAGVSLFVLVRNTAWLRIGLFGGGFGIWLNNQFTASVMMGPASIQLLNIYFGYKLDSTYAVDLASMISGSPSFSSFEAKMKAHLPSGFDPPGWPFSSSAWSPGGCPHLAPCPDLKARWPFSSPNFHPHINLPSCSSCHFAFTPSIPVRRHAPRRLLCPCPRSTLHAESSKPRVC